MNEPKILREQGNRVVIGERLAGLPITAPIWRSIPSHSLIAFRWQKSADGNSLALAYRVNAETWKEVPFFEP